jgi:hypothetical protein
LIFKGCDAANVATYYGVDECVKDLATGLIWEGKSASATGLRGNKLFYTNFDDTNLPQNGSLTPTQAQIDAPSNSIGFKNSVNASGLCGFSNWRMPTLPELTVASAPLVATPALQTAWFPYMDNSGSGAYCSSTGFDQPADATNPAKNLAAVSTLVPSAYTFNIGRAKTFRVMLVR